MLAGPTHPLVKRYVSREAENLSQGGNHPLSYPIDRDDTMSVEKFDNAMAAITLAATVITIALGFMLNL